MDYLDGSYNRGYTKALVDVMNFFTSYSDSLKQCRLYNESGIQKTLQMLVNNRESLRETGRVNVVYDTKNKVFLKKEDKN